MSQIEMATSYQIWPLLAAWVVSIYALYLQGLVVRRVRANERDAGFGWILGGALCLGTGLWAESILGLLALQLPIPVGYVRGVLLASWLPAVAITACVTWMLTDVGLSRRMRVAGVLVVSVGLCLVTVINVSAMVMQPQAQWHMKMALGAAMVVLLACAPGSVLIRHMLQKPPTPSNKVKTLGVLALMATFVRLGQMMLIGAVSIRAGAICLSADQLTGDSLALMLTAVALMPMLLLHLGTIQDGRAHSKHAQLQDSLNQAQAALQDANQHDVATGLLNRLGFERALRQTLHGDCSTVQQLTVFRLNLDGFKSLIETYGYDLGDTTVRFLASRIHGLVRDGDVLSRSDTDEYLLMCNGLSDEHAVAQLAQRLGDALHEPCLIQDQDITLSCSIGIACYPVSTNADQLLSHSQDAMLTARKAGGAVYCFYERGMDRRGAEQVDMQRDLRHAIERNELEVYFQPKLRAHDKALAGVEALLRWTHPERGMVSPVQFIPVAERFGLIGELGLWVLNEACRYIRLWHDAGLNIPVAVNLSAHQLRQPDLELRVRDALKRHRVPARMLIMEITESAAMDDIESSLRVFDMLDAIGVRLSIDDFGTGYSSLSYLRRLPARQLKIDRSFVRDLETSLDAQAIVEAVVRLSHALGLQVVAEGVETQGQAEILARLACDELQGFLFAKPMPEPALLAWLVQRGTTVLSPNQVALVTHVVPGEDTLFEWPEMEAAGS